MLQIVAQFIASTQQPLATMLITIIMPVDLHKVEQAFLVTLQMKLLEDKISWTDCQTLPSSEVSSDENGPQAF